MVNQIPQTDVVVIGGGLAGLSAAAYLARAGRAVTLFEKASHLGGRAATQNHSGYAFNLGGHALYAGGAATRVLEELGISYSYGSPRGILTLYQGVLYPYPASTQALLTSSLLDIGDKFEMMRLLIQLSRLQPRSVRQISVQQWLEYHSKRPRVRKLLQASAHTFTYTTALNQMSMEPFVTQLQLTLKQNVRYIDGGWQTLVEKLHHSATQAGAHIISGQRVEAVEQQNRHVAGVRLSNGIYVPAKAVVVATEPRDAARMINDPALNRSIAALTPLQVACLDIALRRLPRPDHPVIFDMDHPRFLTTQSLFAQITPAGGALIHAFRYLDPAQPADPHEHERELEAFLDVAQPGWRSEVVERFFLPHMDVSGTAPLAGSAGFAGRPEVTVPHIAGLYLAGDWVGQQGYLVDASFASARQAAQLALQSISAAGRFAQQVA